MPQKSRPAFIRLFFVFVIFSFFFFFLLSSYRLCMTESGCLFSEISIIVQCSNVTVIFIMNNFTGLIVTVYCYFLIFSYAVVCIFLSLSVCLSASLFLSSFLIQPFRKSLKGVRLKFLVIAKFCGSNQKEGFSYL